MQLNKGEYRRRYDEAKAAYKARHPDYSDGRCHSHGMLCATKRLLANLWGEWRKAGGETERVTDSGLAAR